jgi:hypothetical protein
MERRDRFIAPTADLSASLESRSVPLDAMNHAIIHRPIAEKSCKSILVFWFFKLLLLKFCLEQFQHMLFCLQDSCFANPQV